MTLGRVGTPLAMKDEEPIRKGRDFDSILPRHDEVATNGSYLIKLLLTGPMYWMFQIYVLNPNLNQENN